MLKAFNELTDVAKELQVIARSGHGEYVYKYDDAVRLVDLLLEDPRKAGLPYGQHISEELMADMRAGRVVITHQDMTATNMAMLLHRVDEVKAINGLLMLYKT